MTGGTDRTQTGLLRRLADGFLDLLYPPRCHVCGAALPDDLTAVMCGRCREQVGFLRSPLCPCCGRALTGPVGRADHFCGDCLRRPPPFDGARSLVHYRAPVDTLLHRLKYRGDTTVLRPLAALIRQGRPPFADAACDILLPVPLHAARLRERGLNQSLVLAHLAFPQLADKIATDLLVRVKKTRAQTGLDGGERRQNLHGAFAVTAPERLPGRQIWLVDDVFTTGTTVAECARTLRKAGAASVRVWTLARA